MKMAGYKRSLLNTIRRRQLKFFGHVNRAGGLEKLLLCGKICGKKSRGKQRIKFTDSLNTFTTNKRGTNNELIRKTENRTEWRAMTVDVCQPDLTHERDSMENCKYNIYHHKNVKKAKRNESARTSFSALLTSK